jgi:hypothetical protein
MLRNLVASTLIITMTSTLLVSPAQAGAIATETALARDRQVVLLALVRPEVRGALEAHGVDQEAAEARVAALSDAEVAKLAAQIDNAPAGADGNFFLLPFYVLILAAKALELAVKVAAFLITLPFRAV